MNRISILKATKKILEMQSGGDDREDLMEMRLNTLKQNAINAGYSEADIEVKWVTNAEYAELLANQPKTPEQQMAEIVTAVQRLLDTTAQQRGYDNIFTLISYNTSIDSTFQVEGHAGLLWRDACWVKCLEIKNDVIAGTREIPTIEQVMAELPVIDW